MKQKEWQTQRRRNNNKQQVGHNIERAVIKQQEQTGLTSIPIKNTYIDMEVQEM